MKIGRQPVERGKTLLTCAVCNAEFWRYNAHIRNTTQSCSRECSYKIKPKKPRQDTEHVCLNCGELFRRRLGFGGTKQFCSATCRIAGLERPKGADHPNWKGGIATRPYAVTKAIRKKVKEIGKCERCASTENLQGHHKVAYSLAPELRTRPDNIEVLCANCHADEHPKLAGMLTIPRTRSGVMISCQVCRTERYADPSGQKTAKFCSVECQLTNLHQILRTKPKTGVIIACEECGADRYVPPKVAKTARFCSKECARISLHRGNRKQAA